MGKINIRVLRNQLNRAAARGVDVQIKSRARAEFILNREKNRFLNEFESHPVSQELSGPSPETNSNTSNTLGGKGNLFSFIGFNQGEQPVEKAKQYFNKEIEIIDDNPIVTIGPRRTLFGYRVKIPSTQDLNNSQETQMPAWDTGSWLLKIENGISGLIHYIYRLKGFPGSRSGTGLQTEKIQSTRLFKPKKYISSMLSKLRARLSGRIIDIR